MLETSRTSAEKLFQMLPVGNVQKIKGNVFSKGRVLVGRTESCDFIIPSGVISAVHAVIEVTNKGCKIYDMNSKNGVYVNGEKVVAKQIDVGDEVSFGNITFKFKQYVSASELPPILDTLEPEKGQASIIKADVEPSEAQLPTAPTVEEGKEDGPYIVYPLSADPKADSSEYIFEDAADLYPIFKYDHGKQAVEVIILFKDKVYSVDYLPEKDGVYSIVGSNPKNEEIEFAYLGKNEKVPFVEISNKNCVVNNLPGYEAFHLTDKGMEQSKERIIIDDEEIVRLVNGDLEIYARKVSSPPKVKPAPMFGRDNTLKKYFALTILLIVLPLMGLTFFYEVDEEMKKEKDPERIATILYKQPLIITKNKTVEKTKKAPPKKQTTKKKTVVKKDKPKKTSKPQQKPEAKKVANKDPGSKAAPKKQVVKKVKRPKPKKSATVAKSAASASRQKTVSASKSVVKRKTVGTVDVYKSADFKSSISSLMAKGGSLKGAKVAASKSSSSIGGATVGGGVETNLKKADVVVRREYAGSKK